MFYLPSAYSHKIVMGFLPSHFATDREVLYKHVEPALIEYWNQKNIRYDFNEHMFRTEYDFSKLNDGEFILATGCSHTVGSGIDKDSMWTTIVEKNLEIPVVNIAAISSDIQVVLRNISVWIKNFAKPKYIIIQIPEPSRFSYIANDGKINTVVPGPGNIKEEFRELETLGLNYNSTFNAGYTQIDLLQCIVSSYGIKTFYFSVGNISEYIHLNFDEPILDCFSLTNNMFVKYKSQNPKMKLRARDGDHGGDLVNLIWSDAITDVLRKQG